MDETLRAFGEELGAAVIAADWDKVHSLFASWLRPSWPPDRIRSFFESDYAEALRAWEIDAPAQPTYCEVGGNGTTKPSDLRRPGSFRPGHQVPPELTDQNFKYWMHLMLMPDEGAVAEDGKPLPDVLSQPWLFVTEENGKLCVGFWCHNPDSPDPA
jgi:hypothetical protein